MPSPIFKALQRHPALARPRKRRAASSAKPAAATEAAPASRAPLSRTPRSLTVTSRRWFLSGSRYSARVPYLRFSGRWLEERGFTVGSEVGVTIEPGRIILTSAAHDSAVDAARVAANMRPRV